MFEARVKVGKRDWDADREQTSAHMRMQINLQTSNLPGLQPPTLQSCQFPYVPSLRSQNLISGWDCIWSATAIQRPKMADAIDWRRSFCNTILRRWEGVTDKGKLLEAAQSRPSLLSLKAPFSCASSCFVECPTATQLAFPVLLNDCG